MSKNHYYTIDESKPDESLKIYLRYVKDPISRGSFDRKRGIYLYVQTVRDEGNFERVGLMHDQTGNNITVGSILIEELGRKSQKKHDLLESTIDFDWVAKNWLLSKQDVVLEYLKDFKKPEEKRRVELWGALSNDEKRFFDVTDFDHKGSLSDYSFTGAGELFTFSIDDLIDSGKDSETFVEGMVEEYEENNPKSWMFSEERSEAFHEYFTKSIANTMDEISEKRRESLIPSIDVDEPSMDEPTLFYFIHPESGCAWIQNYKTDDQDSLAEEIEKEHFDRLSPDDYDINMKVETKAGLEAERTEVARIAEEKKSKPAASAVETKKPIGKRIPVPDFSTGMRHLTKLYAVYAKNNPTKTYDDFIDKLTQMKDSMFAFESDKLFDSLVQSLDEVDSPAPFDIGVFSYERNITFSDPTKGKEILSNLFAKSEGDFPTFRTWVEANIKKLFSPDIDLELIEKSMEGVHASVAKGISPLSQPNPQMEDKYENPFSKDLKIPNP